TDATHNGGVSAMVPRGTTRRATKPAGGPEDAPNDRENRCRTGQEHLGSSVISENYFARAVTAGFDDHQAESIASNRAVGTVHSCVPAGMKTLLNKQELIRSDCRGDARFVRSDPGEIRQRERSVLQCGGEGSHRIEIEVMRGSSLNDVFGANHMRERRGSL